MVASTFHKWAREGQKLYLVGRQTDELRAIASDFRSRYGTDLEPYPVDGCVPGAMERVLARRPTSDRALIAWGMKAGPDETMQR